MTSSLAFRIRCYSAPAELALQRLVLMCCSDEWRALAWELDGRVKA